MKEATGGISIFQIVIVFIIVFAGIMSLTIKHSIAFGVKDEVVNILQEEKAVNDKSIKRIVELFEKSGYRVTGTCPSGYTGYDRNGKTSSSKPSFCIGKKLVYESFDKDLLEKCKSHCKYVSEKDLDMLYYEIILFYQLNIPGLNDILTFKLIGNTRVMFSEDL